MTQTTSPCLTSPGRTCIDPCPGAQVPGGSGQLPGSAREYTVTDLLPGSRYNLTIVATNDVESALEHAVLKTLPTGEFDSKGITTEVGRRKL